MLATTLFLGNTSDRRERTITDGAVALIWLAVQPPFTYDVAGRRTAQITPLGNTNTAIYDAAGRTTATENPLGYRTTLSYDVASRQIATTDADANISTTVYDEAGRSVAQVDALGNPTSTTYDATGRRIAVTDANEGVKTYTHDSAGRIVEQTDPLGRLTSFTYDAAGRQSTILDARGISSTFQYDAANRVTARESTNDATVTFGYDAVGNRTEIQDGTGQSSFTYDALNRRETSTDPAGNTITYSYDGVGQRAKMTAPDGGVFTFAYSGRGQIVHLVNPQGDRTTFSYDVAGRRTRTELANGTRSSQTYDVASQLSQVYNLKSDDTVITGFAYDYDAAGNRTSVLEASGDRVTWMYDAANRLTREQRSGASGYDTTYTYDALGNRLAKNASGVLTTSTYDLANQLETSEDANGVTAYTYDQAGNVNVVEQPSGERTTTTWDDQNRQTGIVLPAGGVTTCTYRFDGFRSSKEDTEGTTKYLWDFENYLAETDEDNEVQAIYTNEPRSYGNLISQYRKGPAIWVPSYYQYDALGSTRALTDEGGDASDTYLYDAWGNEVAVTGTTVSPFRWVGQVGYYCDDATGTFYIRARVYEPVAARWMSQDPLFYPWQSRIELAPTEYAGSDRNLLEYASSCPPFKRDPSGLLDCYCSGKCGAMPAFNKSINDHINGEIIQARRAATVGGPLDMESFRLDLWSRLAMDLPGGRAPNTKVEGWIGGFVGKGTVVAGPRIPPIPMIGIESANCFNITCFGSTWCIGSDKIGHFFQQGHLLHEIKKQKSADYARAFSYFTEGVWMNRKTEFGAEILEIKDFLDSGTISFHGYSSTTKKFTTTVPSPILNISEFSSKWGNTVGTGFPLAAQRSFPDHAANTAGMGFYDHLMAGEYDGRTPGCLFDICRYARRDWVEP